jgi:hypothetical protein
VKVPRPCPLVLLVKVDCRPNVVLGSEEGKVLGSGLLGGERLSIGAEFCVWEGGQQCAELNCIYSSSPYRAVNTLRLCYKNQSVNAV